MKFYALVIISWEKGKLLRISRNFRSTIFESGCPGKSGKSSRSLVISDGLCKRKNVLTSFTEAIVDTNACAGFWFGASLY